MTTPEAITQARRALGRRLAALRRNAGHTQEQFAPFTGYVRSTIANVETGRQVVPRTFWMRCDDALNMNGALLSEYDELEELGQQERRNLAQSPRQSGWSFMAGATLDESEELSTNPIKFIHDTTINMPAPARLNWIDVDHVKAVTQALATSESMFGGGRSSVAGLAQLRWAAELSEIPATADVRAAMVEATGNLAGVAAFTAFDAGDHRAARRCFHFALHCADSSKSWPLRANVFAEMARQEAHLGHFDEALSLIEFAQVRSDRLSATARAMLCAVRARLLANMNRHHESETEVERADEFFANQNRTFDPPWLRYYDDAEHLASTGRAMIPVAVRTRQPTVAAGRISKSVTLHGARYPRARTLSRIRLASLIMAAGDPHEAAAIGMTATREAAQINSVRIVSELQNLRVHARSHAQIPDVSHLVDDIGQLLVRA